AAAAATAAFVVKRANDTETASSQQAESSPPAPPPALASANQPSARRTELVPESIPFITAHDKQRIRDEYVTAPDYKALAMTMAKIAFVSGLTSQEAADKSAMEACEKANTSLSKGTAAAQSERRCDLYASGNLVVTQFTSPTMPPKPWVNTSAQRPFVAADIPLLSQELKSTADKRYRGYSRSKALVISPNGRWYATYGQPIADEAMRRTLERCGYYSGSTCLVVAVEETFVIPIPTLARAV